VNPDLLMDLSRELYQAEKSRKTVDPLSERYPQLDIAGAYQIQSGYSRLRQIEDSTHLLGMKVGATSKAIQDYFGIDQPDFGVLLEDMEVDGFLNLDELIQARIEPELAFVLSQPLSGPGVCAEDVLEATRSVAPCMEIIDSRVHGWRIGLVDTVADNGSSARFVLGEQVSLDHAPDLREVKVEFCRNEEPAVVALGAAVLDHPANAVAWLANTLGALGSGLSADQLVLSGSFTTALTASAGDVFTANFSGIGKVSLAIRP